MIRWIRVLAVLVLALSAAMSVSAQSATPAASDSLLGKAGFPDLSLKGDDNGLIDAPTSVEAGRYLVTLTNSGEKTNGVDLVGTTDKYDYDAVAKVYENSTGDFPKAVYEIPILGGTVAPGGGYGQAIIDLKPGTYVLGYGVDKENDTTNHSSKLTVTGSFPKVNDPKASVTVTMYEMGFDMPKTISSGDAIWKLTNTGDQPHFMEIVSYPDPLTKDEVLTSLQGEFSGTPAANGLDPSKIQFLYDSSLISTGQREWVELNLPAGHYAVLCFVPDKETGEPHALMGMIAVFDVK